MSPLTQQVVEGIEGLPEASQRQILDFVEFLIAKHQESYGGSPGNEGEQPKSFAETARDIIGMGEGPGDLSTNPDYMGGYGQ
ncbi:MAG: hypothetical protein AAF329_27315 [Cyanobacteria bacterium P01_A01_bin.17]